MLFIPTSRDVDVKIATNISARSVNILRDSKNSFFSKNEIRENDILLDKDFIVILRFC